MNKTLALLLGGVAILALVGALVFANTQKQRADTEANQETGTESMEAMTQKDGAQTITTNFLQLIKTGKNYNCTFATTDESGNTTSGVVYVAAGGDKLNGDFTMSQSDGTQLQSALIRDGEYTYIWSSEMEQGLKIKIDPNDENLFGSSERTEEQVGFSQDQEVDFNCRPWTVDPSKFIPPSDIEFVDFSAQMDSMMQQFETSSQGSSPDTQGVQDACAACNQIPAGANRDQCLQALGC